MGDIAAFARIIATQAIDAAKARTETRQDRRGGSSSCSGRREGDHNRFKEAVAKYKEAVAKAESA